MDLYVILKSDGNLPVKEIILKPRKISFKESIPFKEIEDKKLDNTDAERITCYYDLKRAIQMENLDSSLLQKFDVYQPIDTNENFYSYEYLIKRGLIQPKTILNRESWFIAPTKFRYLGTIETNNKCEYKILCKNYHYSDCDKDILDSIEEGFVENQVARHELKKKKIYTLYNCSITKSREIVPDTFNYGNRISGKRYSSFWYDSFENALNTYIVRYLLSEGVIDEDDFALLYNQKYLYLNKEIKPQILNSLNNFKFYLNIINIPEYSLFSGNHIGFGWDIFDYTYTYDKPIYVDGVREVSLQDMLENIIFVSNNKIIGGKKANIINNYERKLTHGYIFKNIER